MRQSLLAFGLFFGLCAASGAGTVQVDITVRDKGSGQPVPCRIHLKDAAGKARRAGELPFWFDHFAAPGKAQVQLPPGKYTIEIERGPEFVRIADAFEVQAGPALQRSYDLERLVDLAAEGWWAGDLHVHRPVEAIELLMRAEDLHVAPVITWWNKKNLWAGVKLPADPLVRFDGNRFYQMMAGEDEREGGALLYFHLPRPLPLTSAVSREYPSPLKFAEEARLMDEGVWIDIEKPFWWDVPVWLASGWMKSIGLANNHMCRDRMSEKEAWGKPRLEERLPPPLGNGYWTQEIYYQLLNAGLRVPPSAGSASGVLPNPPGYNRVYVYLGKEMDHRAWWQGLRAGRSFVTNGPLLRVTANGKLPGTVFADTRSITLDLKAELTTQDPIRFVDIIKNGRVERRVPYQEVMKSGTLGPLEFKESGWFLVRAIAENPKTFRFGSTAPFYVEVGSNKERISKTSAAFFLDWTRERMGRVQLDDVKQREEVLAHHLRAERFWQERVARANAD